MFDNKYTTSFTDNSVPCYVGFDFGTDISIEITKLVYFPSLTMPLKSYKGTNFEGLDATTKQWKLIATVGSNIALGRNTWI